MSIVSWILSKGERIGSRVIGHFIWPPCGASAIVIEDDELLVVRTEDYIMLPGGLLDNGESFEECVIREVKEETGIDISIIEEIDRNVRNNSGVEFMYKGKVEGGNLKGSWEGNPEYIPVEDASEENWRWNRDIDGILEKMKQ